MVSRASESDKVATQTQPTPGNSMAGRAPEALFGQVFGSPSVQATASNVGRSAAGLTNAGANFIEGNGAIVAALIFLVVAVWLVRNVA